MSEPREPTYKDLSEAHSSLKDIMRRRKALEKALEAVEKTTSQTEPHRELVVLARLALRMDEEASAPEIRRIRDLVEAVEKGDEPDRDESAVMEEDQIQSTEENRRGPRPSQDPEEISRREKFIHDTFGKDSVSILARLKKIRGYTITVPVDTMSAMWRHLKEHYGAADARKIVMRTPVILMRDVDALEREISNLAELGFSNPEELFRKNPGFLGFSLETLQRKLHKLERVLELFGEGNPNGRALSLAEDFPPLLTFGLPKLFISIRILRALEFPTEDVDASVCNEILTQNVATLALALRPVMERGLRGRAGLEELLRRARGIKQAKTPKDDRLTRLQSELTTLTVEGDESIDTQESVEDLVKIMRRALELETRQHVYGRNRRQRISHQE